MNPCVFLTEGSDKHFSLDDFDFLVFHSPYCKLVQKSVARLMLNDFLKHPSPDTEAGPFAGFDAFRYLQRTAVRLLVLSNKVLHPKGALEWIESSETVARCCSRK